MFDPLLRKTELGQNVQSKGNRSTNNAASDKIKTRSGLETLGKIILGSGSPAVGNEDKSDKADKDKAKQLKLV